MVPIQLYTKPSSAPNATTAAAISTTWGTPANASTAKAPTAIRRAKGLLAATPSQCPTVASPLKPSAGMANRKIRPAPPNSRKVTTSVRQARASMSRMKRINRPIG